jgi:NADPH-dependent 2,4-dienoyl-CoA reductase/sulfur reductase-like enzyme
MVFPCTNPTKSFWIEAAKSPLRDLRSGDEVPTETDVAVIGSGYAGASTAYWMHKVGFRLSMSFDSHDLT